MQVIIWYIANNIKYIFEMANFNVHLRYYVLLKIKIFYVYIKLLRTIILTSAPSITSTFKRILTSKCLCRVRFCFLINILKKQYEAEQALDLHPQALIGLKPTMSQGFGQVCMWHGLTSEVFSFPDDENSDSSRNVHVLAGHTPDTVASPKKFTKFRYCEGFSLDWFLLECDTMYICR